MSTFLKPHTTINEQIKILKGRGLIIENEAFAFKYLEKVGYYNLINGYKAPFVIQKNGTEQYIKKTKFKYIVNLYEFDLFLKNSFLTSVLKIERVLKSVISYNFASTHGELNYFDLSNFNTYNEISKIKAKEIIEKIKKEKREALHPRNSTNKHYNCVRHYEKNYGNVPIWIMFNIINLNDLSKFYACLLPQTKKKIAAHVSSIYGYTIDAKELKNIFHILVEIRNACAHCQRLFTYTTKYLISNNAEIKKICEKIGSTTPTNNLISVVVIFKQFMTEDEFKLFFFNLCKHIGSLLIQIPDNYWTNIAYSMNIDLKTLFSFLPLE